MYGNCSCSAQYDFKEESLGNFVIENLCGSVLHRQSNKQKEISARHRPKLRHLSLLIVIFD